MRSFNTQKKGFQEMIEKITTMSSSFKILSTSREVSIHSLEYFMQHRVYVLSLDAAISMLKENEVILTTEESENIANLTGRIPLALKIVCALLHYTSPQEIITELQRHPINIFNSSELPERKGIHVSFSLSLRYLDKELRTFSFSLAFFPGSFIKKNLLVT